MAQTLFVIFMIYVLVGLAFAGYFVTVAVNRIDPATKQSPWSFRIIIFPGCVALWPILLFKLFHAKVWP